MVEPNTTTSPDLAKASTSTSRSNSNVVMVVGYFDKKNMGDDLYCDVWKYLIETRYADMGLSIHLQSLEVPSDEMRNAWTSKYGQTVPRCVILGGGDVMTVYFIRRLRDMFNTLAEMDYRWYEVPIHAVSVAVPFKDAVELGACDIFSSVVSRPGRFLEELRSRIGHAAVTESPDISCHLLNMYPDSRTRIVRALTTTRKTSIDKRDVFLVCVAAQTCGFGTSYYDNNIQALVRGIADFQAKNNCIVEFIPFDTSGQKSDDRNVIHRLLQLLPQTGQFKEWFDASNHTATAVFQRFQSNDVRGALCMRYHSHMMAMLAVVPIASIAVTEKVKCLLHDAQLFVNPSTYVPRLDNTGVPTALDADDITRAMVWAWQHDKKIRKNQAQYVHGVVMRKVPKLDAHMRAFLEHPATRPNVSSVRNLVFPEEMAEDAIRCVIQHYIPNDMDSDEIVARIVKGGGSLSDVLRADIDPTFVASMLCMCLTSDMYPSYHYGLSEKVMTSTHLVEELKWIICDNAQKAAARRGKAPSHVLAYPKLFECPTIDRASIWGLHRAGWAYVLQHMWYLHSKDDTLPIFDDYCDATFNWLSEVLTALEVVPYRRAWYGTFHHTANTEFGPNNLVNVFQNEAFLKSLPSCRGIFTLSESLRNIVRRHLVSVGHSSIPVHSLVHPSEMPTLTFSMDAFLKNPNKKLVQIGCWYREPYMLYTLDLPKKDWISKAALRGRHMHSNFPPPVMHVQATSEDPYMNIGVTIKDKTVPLRVECDSDAPENDIICRGDGVSNMFVVNMLKNMATNQYSVDVIDTLDDEGYDKLFTNNIIFLHMADASAVNTIIEAVLRNTPVLVNRLPAIEEVLGSDYPLYYTGATHAANLACDIKVIAAAHEHLKKIDKAQFRIEKFITAIAKHIGEI